MYNEIYCSIFEKQKIIGESERSNFQHLESLTQNDRKSSFLHRMIEVMSVP